MRYAKVLRDRVEGCVDSLTNKSRRVRELRARSWTGRSWTCRQVRGVEEACVDRGRDELNALKGRLHAKGRKKSRCGGRAATQRDVERELAKGRKYQRRVALCSTLTHLNNARGARSKGVGVQDPERRNRSSGCVSTAVVMRSRCGWAALLNRIESRATTTTTTTMTTEKSTRCVLDGDWRSRGSRREAQQADVQSKTGSCSGAG